MELLNKWFGMFGNTSTESTTAESSRSNVRLVAQEHPEYWMPRCLDDSRIEIEDPIDTSTILIENYEDETEEEN